MATNLWVKFKSLLPNSPMVIVTVEAVNGDGTSTVTTPAGGTMRVLGDTVAATNKAYVRDGVILYEAPNLQHFEIEV